MSAGPLDFTAFAAAGPREAQDARRAAKTYSAMSGRQNAYLRALALVLGAGMFFASAFLGVDGTLKLAAGAAFGFGLGYGARFMPSRAL